MAIKPISVAFHPGQHFLVKSRWADEDNLSPGLILLYVYDKGARAPIYASAQVLSVFVTRLTRWRFLFVCVDSLRPSQHFFSYVGTGLSGLKQRIKFLTQGYNAVPSVRL